MQILFFQSLINWNKHNTMKKNFCTKLGRLKIEYENEIIFLYNYCTKLVFM